MGEAIQSARSISDHLYVAEKFVWLPADDNLQPHLRTQLVHHEKRRRWGSQLLEGLGSAALSSWEANPMQMYEDDGNIWSDARFARVVQSVAIPMEAGNEDETINRPEKEGVWMAAALKGLHVISGCIAPTAPSSSSSFEPLAMKSWISIHESISSMIQSVDDDFDRLSLKDAIELRWAIRGLTARLQAANTCLPSDDATMSHKILDFTTPNLNKRVSNLPFDIISHCLSWQHDYRGYPAGDLLPELLQSIPFNFDTLTTRTGNAVIERRGTAWLAEDGIGALAYSGKLMAPAAVPEPVREIMRDMERQCAEQGEQATSQRVSLSDGLVEY